MTEPTQRVDGLQPTGRAFNPQRCRADPTAGRPQAIQIHGALGYSTDTKLESMMRHARSARLVDGADEVHLTQICRHVLEAYRSNGSCRQATGLDLLF